MTMNIDYQLYIQNCIKLAKTIVIKSSATCNAINGYLAYIHYDDELYVDSSQPNTWKYYLNISGEYHKSDTMMSVISWDTGELINFTKANLNIHKATKTAYEFGTQQYIDLLAQYPEQEMLILGILNPVDINVAINATDGTILTYPDDLVEVNETTLISKLNNWLSGYLARWANSQYAISDEYYTANNLGIMYLYLIPAIITFRLEACKTREAHSFHIKQYLISNGISADVIRYLTNEQALFFYRNIAYIQRNIGKVEIFKWVVDNVLTKRLFPLSAYKMRHSDTGILNKLYSTINFKKEQINSVYDSNAEGLVSLPVMLNKEQTLTSGNSNYINDNANKIKQTFQDSLSNVVITKVLESVVINYEDSGQYSLQSIALNHWLYLSYIGYYNITVHIENVRTGEIFALSAKEAFILYFYAYCKTIGITPTSIPEFPATFVQRAVTPTVSELMSVVDHSYIDEEVAQFALSLSPRIDVIKSVVDFNTMCSQIQVASKFHRHLPAYFEDRYGRAQAEAMVGRIYGDCLCKLDNSNKTYEQWLSDMHLDLSEFDQTDYSLLYKSIIKSATGSDLVNENSITNIYNAMMSLMNQLSSYSVQYIKNSSSGEKNDLGFIMMRFGNFKNHGGIHYRVDCDMVDVLDYKSHGNNKSKINTDVATRNAKFHVRANIPINVPLDVTVTNPNNNFRFSNRVFTNGVGVKNISVVSN